MKSGGNMPAVEAEPLVPGQIVAERYRVERIIGRGGMGVVAAVRHVTLGELFALKVLTAAAFENAASVERFVREAQTTARLKSPHALRISDAGRLPDGAPYLVMEYLEGRDLEQELDARGPLPAAEAATYVMQACDVLAEAHAQGIVHRDIKSANLFLTRLPNGAPCIKVLDFGIALHADPVKGQRMTSTTAVFGTPLYMSPEQMRSSKLVDPRADIWSLGVVLYELCLGGVPFDASTMTELVTKVLTDTPTFPAMVRPGMCKEIEPIILRCLERDPAKRYPSAAALSQALAPIAAGQATGTASVPPAAAAPAPHPFGGHTAMPGSQGPAAPPPHPFAGHTAMPGSQGAAGPMAGAPQPTTHGPYSGGQARAGAMPSPFVQGPAPQAPVPHGPPPYVQAAAPRAGSSSTTVILLVIGAVVLLGFVFLVGVVMAVSTSGNGSDEEPPPEPPPAPAEE
jgi:hypothetical protein